MGFYNGKHIVSSEHFDRYLMERIFETADIIETMDNDPAGQWELRKVLRNRYDQYVWWDPNEVTDDSKPLTALIHTINAASLRTVPGSWQAIRMLGGESVYYHGVLSPFMTARALKGTVGAKKESLFSIVRTAHELGFDMILLRSDSVKEEGTFQRVVDLCERARISIPFVSLGEGDFDHPLQMLGELALIREIKGEKLRNGILKIALIGDVESSRVFHALAFGLAHYGGTIYCVSPEGNMFPDNIWQRVQALNRSVILERQPPEIAFRVLTASDERGLLYRYDMHNPFEIIKEVDVCIFSRLQDNLKHGKTKEEMGRLEREFVSMYATPTLRAAMPHDVLVGHALPSGDEYEEELHYGIDPRFRHWRGVKKGLYTKAAVFMHLMKSDYPLNYYWNKAREEMLRRKSNWIKKASQW